MERTQIGHTKLVNRYFMFLVERYGMNFCFDVLPNTVGADNPTYVYSFYNSSGCFTIQEVAQRGEWDCYVAKSFSRDPHKRLSQKINQNSYTNKRVFTVRTFLKVTAGFIRNEISRGNCFWGISVK